MKKLIINADDYGLTRGCDQVIAGAMRTGAVSSTSVLIWDGDPPELTAAVRGRAGVHLRLTDGGPATWRPRDVPSLVNAAGMFAHSQAEVAALAINSVELHDEWNAQIQFFIRAAGCQPTHLDSHRHTHDLPLVREVYAELCEEFHCAGVPLSDRQRDELRARGIPCADFTEIRWTDGMEQTLRDLLVQDFDRYEVVHLMTHPGVNDADLRKLSTMNAVRQCEFNVLTSKLFRAFLREQQIEVVGMEALARPEDPLAKIDLVYCAWNRLKFTEASLTSLLANTDWARVRRLVLYDDGSTDGTADLLGRVAVLLTHGAEHVNVEMVRTQLRSPVAIMNDYLTMRKPSPWFAKIDNDVVLPPGWLPSCLEVLRASVGGAGVPVVDLLGIEAMHEPVLEGVQRVAQTCGHIGGIGLMRTAAFAELPVPAGRLGFSDWQIKHDVRKAWLNPSLPVILLDRLPFEPWATLSVEYEAKGWQRPWKRYTEEDSKLWQWWSPVR